MGPVPLKSRFGCRRCKDRRRKCDEVKPVCGECTRLGFVCHWVSPSSSDRQAATARSSTYPVERDGIGKVVADVTGRRLPERTRNVVILSPQSPRADTFDSPAILRTDAVPINASVDCKHVLQYLSECGTSMLRFPVRGLPSGREINIFREGFQMASRSPLHLEAYLCLGAGHLSRIDASYEKVALKHYTSVMYNLRSDLLSGSGEPPAEWTCAVAAILSFYELIVFHSAKSRLAHLIGFHRLVEARIYHQLTWAPLNILFEQYIHSLVLGSLFHPTLLVGQRSATYIDELICTLNQGPRPLGREIAGVPEELTTAVFKLAVLNIHDINQSPWDGELLAVASTISQWKPPPYAFAPTAGGLLLVSKLFHLACICLLQNITNRTADATDYTVRQCLHQAKDALDEAPSRFRPANSLVWPLTILSIFTQESSQRRCFEGPILMLVDIAKVEGYRSILSFLSLMEEQQLGPAVFQKPDLLSLIHM